MGRRTPLFKTLPALIFAWVAFASLPASSQNGNEAANYSLSWAGLPMGRALLKSSEQGGKYNLSAEVKFTGIASLFAPHTSLTDVSGNVVGGVYHPRIYSARYREKEKPERADIKYDAQGYLLSAVIVPPDPPGKRDAPARDQVRNALDFLSALAQLRRAVAVAAQKGDNEITLKLFDGRRLMNINAPIEETKEGFTLRARRSPISGFTAKELKRIRKGEPPLVVDIGPGPEFEIRHASLKMGIGSLEATLEKAD